MSQESAVPRRRNGRQQACEPCRKRKTACDHTLPTCQRCKRRKTSIDCVYLAAPMTRSPGDVDADTPDSTSTLPVLNISSKVATSYGQDSTAPLKSVVQPSSLFSGPAGFLGPTSFSDVFLENRSTLEPLRTSEVPISNDIGDSIQSATVLGHGEALNADLIRLGIKVLSQIPDETTCNVLFSRHINPNDGWIRSVAAEILSRDLWATFGTYLHKRSSQGLETLSRVICTNATAALYEEDDPTRWVNSFSGSNLRWEALGILFTYWALGALSSPENDPIFATRDGSRKDRRQFVIELKEGASSCIALCSHADCANPLVVYLLYKNCIVQSMISGDTSLILWRLHGDLVSVTTSLGLHRDDSTPSRVSLRSEIRRRVYAAVFNIDKVISTLVGRPPMLSRRYSSVTLPLDVSDEALLSGEPVLTKAASALDVDGWNTEGQIYSTTILRARTMFAFIRDEILEIVLGSITEQVAERVKQVEPGYCLSIKLIISRELKQESTATYAKLPPAIIYRPEDLKNPDVPSPILYSRLVTRMDHLHNLFLLERLLIKYKHANGQELLDIGREMLALTLAFWKQRDYFAGLHHDYSWMIMYYAVPASGTLCVELLKQRHPLPSPGLTIPRSETIQNLTMFAEFLDWVKPSAPNATLCFRIRDIIGRVLDQVLDAPLAASQTAFDFEMPGDFVEWDDFNGFDLLDTFGWVGEPFG